MSPLTSSVRPDWWWRPLLRTRWHRSADRWISAPPQQPHEVCVNQFPWLSDEGYWSPSSSLPSSCPPVIAVAAADIWTTVTVDTVG
uniref:Uncharacterized protein n=1 Tax=Knipowitschia caucasica TaxID=637954 RepID=A0AAV2LSK4_KNICA